MKVKEVMHKAMVVEDNIKVKDAAKLMSEKGIGSLIIMKRDKIIGIITERDVMKNVGKLNMKISSVMSKNVKCIDIDESLDNAAILMSKYKIKRLPILKKGRLAGIITATELLAHSEDLNENFFFD
jgi:CBS domain-containing protein